MDTNKKSTALAVPETYLLPALNGNMGMAMAEEMDGLTLSFPRVKIPSGGGLAFEVPGDDPESPDIKKEIIGIIVDHHPINAYWEAEYTGGNVPPDCSSMNAKEGSDGSYCPGCKHNQWGTARKGNGKACKNMHRVYVLMEGEVLPLLITVPPTSLKNLSDYISRVVTKGNRTYEVITKITLKKAQSADDITYSQAIFALEGILSPEQAKVMAEYSEGIKIQTRQLQIMSDEYRQDSENDSNEDRF